MAAAPFAVSAEKHAEAVTSTPANCYAQHFKDSLIASTNAARWCPINIVVVLKPSDARMGEAKRTYR